MAYLIVGQDCIFIFLSNRLIYTLDIFSFSLLIITKELKAQAPYYCKYVLEYKKVNGKVVYSNISTKNIDTTFYLEQTIHYAEASRFKRGTISYQYQIDTSESVTGEFDFPKWEKKNQVNINPEPTLLKYDSEKKRHIIIIKNETDTVEYIFKYYRAVALSNEEWDAQLKGKKGYK